MASIGRDARSLQSRFTGAVTLALGSLVASGCARAEAADGKAGTRATAVVEPQPTDACRAPAVRSDCSGDFCRVEPGCYMMGAPRGEFGAARFSNRQVRVELSRPFLIGKTELTRDQWHAEGFPLPAEPDAQKSDADCRAGDCPLTRVGFFDAVAFANRYSERRQLPACYELAECSGEIGRGLECRSVKVTAPSVYECTGYRLPTEAEWEYAARAGSTEAFYSGPIARQSDAGCHFDPNFEPIGWYCKNSEGGAQRVAQKAPNGWGLHDTLGNVFEWCNDLKTPKGYADHPLLDPIFPAELGPELSASKEFPDRIARGGSYDSSASAASVSFRSALPDTTAAPNVGFRLARTLR